MSDEPISRYDAEREISAILARVPDGNLAEPDRIELGRDGVTVAWYGGKGWHIEPGTVSAARHATLAFHELFAVEWLHRERERRYGTGYEFRDGKQINASEATQ